MFQVTTAISKLLQLTKRKKIVQGGTWGGKTYGIIAIAIDFLAKTPNRSLTVVAETIPSIKKGALNDFKEIMYLTGRWIQDHYNATDRIYTFGNGSKIEFNSYENVGKAQAAGKRTDLFINEAPYISFEIANALMIRTSGNIWIDFNPTSEFWAHTEVLPNNDAEFIKINYKDNEALPDTILEEINDRIKKSQTSNYWKNWCKVYVEGEIGNLEGVVLSNWSIIDSVPEEAELKGSGLDYGYTNDPTALISRYNWNGKRLYDESIYQKGLSNSEISKLIKNKDLNNNITAESSEPKSNAELKSYGLDITAVTKTKDSIKYGLSLLQEQDFLVTARSVNLIKELRSYVWKKDKNGNLTGAPIDLYNHGIDAMRYDALENFSKRKTVRITQSKLL